MEAKLRRLSQRKIKEQIISIRVDPEVKEIYEIGRANRFNLTDVFRDLVTTYLRDNERVLTGSEGRLTKENGLPI